MLNNYRNYLYETFKKSDIDKVMVPIGLLYLFDIVILLYRRNKMKN